MTFAHARENQIIPWQGVYFLPTLFYKIIETYILLWWNMINTIGKKIHTLVKNNTPRCLKIRQECGFTQKVAFFYVSLCFLPHCCILRKVRLMLPNTYQEIYDTHTCLNFWKTCQNVCLYSTYEKVGVTLLLIWGSTCSKKRLAGRSFFQILGLQGPGRVSPSGRLRAAPSSRLFMLFWGLVGLLLCS